MARNMAPPYNFVDLTQDSDEEGVRRERANLRAQPRPVTNPAHFASPYQHQQHHIHHPEHLFNHQHVRSNYLNPIHQVYPQHIHPPRPRSPPRAPSQPRPSMSSKPPIVDKDVKTQYSASTQTAPMSKPKGRSCINCADVGVTCDGEKPCSACVEPGLICIYPGEKPSPSPYSALQNLASRSPHTVSGLATRTKSPAAQLSYTTQQSDLLPNRLISTEQTEKQPDPFQAYRGLQFSDTDESDDDEIPLAIADLEEVKQLLKKHEVRMRDHRAYLLQPLLSQAKLDSSRAQGPESMRGQRSPFNKFIASVKSNKAPNTTETNALPIQIKSHKIGAPKKWVSQTMRERVVECDSNILPKYKSIGRLGNSLLAPNIRTLKYWPYFPDEEELDPSAAKKSEELEERYQHDDAHLLAQRKCSELVNMWRPWVEDFVSKLGIEFRDILYWFLHTTEKTPCETCDREILREAFVDFSRLLNKPTERSLTLARLSATALQEVAKISMWHIALGTNSIKDMIRQMEPPKKSASTLCSICFLHNCLSHGAYQEPEETGAAMIMGGNVEIDDEEANHNFRVSAVVPNKDHSRVHQCGLYCVSGEARVKDILGRRKNGAVGGIHNHAIHVPHLTFDNDKNCGGDCFWSIEKRTQFGTVLQTKGFEPTISDEAKQLFRVMLRTCSNNQRAPCMLAEDVDGLDCVDAFYFMLAENQRVSHYSSTDVSTLQQGTRKISKLAAGVDVSLSADLDERPPFIPCSHAGPCTNNPDCTCAQSKVHCEWFCGCDTSCERRFPGCKCAGANKVCFNDKSCECWKHNRECDPWLCGTCGTVEVLDPQNKYDEDIRRGRCKNNRIQLELPARTIKAPSEVQGWGLYAGENIEDEVFVGEYKGETVGNQESDRRGAVYANIGQEYLFVMNRDQQIDGSNFGNKTRFINNSQREDYINVFAKKLLCNGVQRVMLYAKKPILAGEELLYNYNYPASVTKKFWERGEGPTSGPGAVTAKPAIEWTQSRVAKAAVKQDGEQSPDRRTDDVRTSKKDTKRKRASEGDTLSFSTEVATTVRQEETSLSTGGLAIQDDSEDPDFEVIETGDGSTSAQEDDDEDVDSDEVGMSNFNRRTRNIHPTDRRRGGLAQARAWETRRKRNAKGK